MHKNKLFIIALVFLTIVSAYFFMNQTTESPETKMSGQFRLNPTFGMQGYQGLYFVDQDINGAVYRVEGVLLEEITNRLNSTERHNATVSGLVRSEMEKIKILGPADEPRGKYEYVERKIINVTSYELAK